MFSDLPKVRFGGKQYSLFNMIYFLLEKVIRYAKMPVDCLRASKLVTLGYLLTHDRCISFQLRQFLQMFFIHAHIMNYSPD